MENYNYVSPFHGNFESDLPVPKGIAANWFFLKAQAGNTHPGAVLPFSIMSACAYSGGYSSGYGPYWYNTHSRPPRIFSPDNLEAAGFSHFHHSGAGHIGRFYNYWILTPSRKDKIPKRFMRFPLQYENAAPGRYSCTLNNIQCEIVAGEMSCVYRFAFPDNGGVLIVDPQLNGLFHTDSPESPYGVVEEIKYESNYLAAIVNYDFRLYTHMFFSKADRIQKVADGRYHIYFSGGVKEVSLGFSFTGREQAKDYAEKSFIDGFENLCELARKKWSFYLDAIQIEADEETKEIFYSCLYHSLVKPVNVTEDSPFFNDRQSWTDFSTMWDIYKTQLPLLFTLYGEISSSIVNSMMNNCEYFGYFPNHLGISMPDDSTDMQARGLAWHSIYDALIRGIRNVDYNKALDLILMDLNRICNSDFLQKGKTRPYPSHTWDLSCGCFAAALIAEKLGRKEDMEFLLKLSDNWKNILDCSTGLITSEGKFYEGSEWNYSYRLLPQMHERINSSPNFFRDIELFFGYGCSPVEQSINADNHENMLKGRSLNRFQGFNNETDIETPYAYIYAGKHERTAEICRHGLKYMYSTGRGGLCGNDDSGGLSSFYIVNALGLFPVAGQNCILIGSPNVKQSILRLNNNNIFEIVCENFADDALYVHKAILDGEVIDRLWLTVEEIMKGGCLRLFMNKYPNKRIFRNCADN